MPYYFVEPQVAGELGPSTVYASRFPDTVDHMEYLFDEWPCDDLVQAYPCFAASEALRNKLGGATGVEFHDCELGVTDYFSEKPAPPLSRKYYRLVPVGEAGKDDFGAIEGRLVVSEKVKFVLNSLNLRHFEHEPFTVHRTPDQ